MPSQDLGPIRVIGRQPARVRLRQRAGRRIVGGHPAMVGPTAGHAGHTGPVRILSLLPSATEILYALGLEDQLVGVTHECDWPPEAAAKRVVTASVLAQASAPAELDQMVRDSVASGTPIYRVDDDAVRELRPDLVISQDLCAVCAVPSGHVGLALAALGCSAQVLSLDPTSLDDVVGCVERVGEATGAGERARTVAADLRGRIGAVEEAVSGRPRPRTFALEWSDPPFNGGHWVPDMIERAGGEPVLGSRGAPSARITWDRIAEAGPDALVFMPCGHDLEAACEEARDLVRRPELDGVAAIFAVDASAYFSRPGPRLVDGVELLASVLHPGAVAPRASGGVRRVR